MTTGKTYADQIKTRIPDPKTEGWRYADLSLVRGREQTLAGEKDLAKTPDPVTGWPVIVIGNGRVVQKPKGLKGVEISFTPPGVNKEKPEIARKPNPLGDLAKEHAKTGAFVKVKTGASLEGLEIIFLEEGTGEGARHIHNQIVLEEKSKASIFLRTLNRRDLGWINAVTSVVVRAEANLTLISDFEAGDKTLTSGLTEAEIGAFANFTVFSLGGGIPSLRHEVEIDLKGKGATSNLAGGLLAGKSETIDVLTRINHISGGTKSNQTFRGVAAAGGKTAFQGRVRVEENAQKIEAHQNCHNLILDRGGEANVKPELLIFADDVICSHGATVGEVDEDALFYMMQRGLSEAEARSILVRAFLGQVLAALEDETLARHFEEKFNAWMAETV